MWVGKASQPKSGSQDQLSVGADFHQLMFLPMAPKQLKPLGRVKAESKKSICREPPHLRGLL